MHPSLPTTFTAAQNISIQPMTTFTAAQIKKSTRFDAMGALTSRSPCFRSHRRPWRNCARARRHSHTQADTNAGADVRHAWWRQREGLTHRRRRTCILSARDDIQPGGKKESTRFAVMGGLTSYSRCWIRHHQPWRNCARARRHSRTQADTETGADVKHEWWQRRTHGGDSVRGQPTDGGDAPLTAHDDLHRQQASP